MKIGMRIPAAARDLDFANLCVWCREAGFDGIDVGLMTDEIKRTVDATGLEIGTSDLPNLAGLFGTDEEAAATISASTGAIDAAADRGVLRLFTALIPADGSKGRRAAFDRLTETFGPILMHAEKRGARIAIEGYPGSAPWYPTIGATPETAGALLAAFPTRALVINYDPSHLIRIGVDHLRFLREFRDRVIQVHGKDALIDKEALYLHGTLGPSLSKPLGWSEGWWRYTIPGEGQADWAAICAELDAAHFDGFISVELEDFRYRGNWPLEAEGLKRSLRHLALYA
jgi:sugar phosphate isomerase/epimerase